ncbi:MAG: beta-propeller fold lactonase family protein [Spirochaetaceae bacterium]|jgi:YVTN family beta-propeller protein|nr:beta-propeller fold lactonase family protein [Spirochaetaceae bacterium]
MKNLRLFILFLFCTTAIPSLQAQMSFRLKSAPADLNVYFNDELIKPVSVSGAIREYRIPAAGTLRFSASGYRSIEWNSARLPVKKGQAEIKLENEKGVLRYIGEYNTGSQPKSAYFSPNGQRLFVPLLNDKGIDVFRIVGQYLQYEKRLEAGNRPGFVEALCDERRRELWVSNMEENKVHIFNLDSLELISSHSKGGTFPKVIVQSPDGALTLVSNWLSMDISVFDSDTKKLLRRIPVGGTPRGMAFSPDGSLVYTAIYDAALVVVVDMTANKVIKRWRFSQGEGAARHIIYRDDKLYVSDMFRGTVNILDAATGALLRSVRLGFNINTIILSPDGKYIFASSRGKNNPVDYTLPGPDFGAIYMVDAQDLTLLEKVWGRNQPTGLAVSPDGKFLVFTDFLDANLELYRIER